MKQSANLYRILANRFEKRKRYFEGYLDYAKAIKEKAGKILGEVRVLVFGSIIGRRYSPDSDIDILVISDNIPDSVLAGTKIKLQLTKDFISSPFQIHLVTPEQYAGWYKNFIKKNYVEI